MYEIMLVEDDKNISKLIKKSIEAWDFNCAVVSDFENVVDEFIKLEPHLVLMDINLPTYNGFYWCEKIRKLSKVPIIFISSRSTNMDIVMAVNMGGDDYIIKPFSTEVLIAKMSALLRRTYSYYAQTDLEVIEHNGAR
jgi:DNA-binding response OmpR family regulator